MANLNLKKLVDRDILQLVLKLFKENYDQNVSDRGYLTTSQVQALIDAGGFQNEDEVKALATEAVQTIVDGAPDNFNTLKEIAEYIAEHGDVYNALVAKVNAKVDKTEFETTLEDYVKTEDLNTTLNDYATKTEVADTYVTKVQLNALEMSEAEAREIVASVFTETPEEQPE